MEQKKGNLWAGMTIFANYAIVLILTVLLLGSLSALSSRLLGVMIPSAALLAATELSVVFSLWLGVHSVKKITPIDPKNYVAVSIIAASPIIFFQIIGILIYFGLGLIPISAVINFAFADGIIIGLSYFFLSRESVSFKDNARWIAIFAAVLFAILFVSGAAKDFGNRLPFAVTAEKEMTEEERAEYEKALNELYEAINKGSREGISEVPVDASSEKPQAQSRTFSEKTDPIQPVNQKVATQAETVYSHPDWNVFSFCEGQPTSPVPTSIMESDNGIILIKEISAYNPETSSKYEITVCRGFIGWAPEKWFKDGKLEAYFKYGNESQPLNIPISGPQRFAGLAPFKIDFGSFNGSVRITRGTVVIIKANFNPGENPTLNLDVETII